MSGEKRELKLRLDPDTYERFVRGAREDGGAPDKRAGGGPALSPWIIAVCEGYLAVKEAPETEDSDVSPLEREVRALRTKLATIRIMASSD